jgi:translation initiation factor 1
MGDYPENVRRDPVRLVYSTAVGSVCATCGWPAKACKCSSREEEKVPSKVVVKLRVEKKGRGGKTVTVLDGLPRNSDFLDGLGKELKKLLGTGGTAGETLIELQGDHRAAIRRILSERGFGVKG